MSPAVDALRPQQVTIDESVKLLKRWHIDAYSVSSDSWDQEGYEVFLEGEGGQREWRSWPIDFPVEKLIEIRGGVGV